MCIQLPRFSYIHVVAASMALSNCFLNDLSVNNMSLFNFHKNKTVWQSDVRSHGTPDL